MAPLLPVDEALARVLARAVIRAIQREHTSAPGRADRVGLDDGNRNDGSTTLSDEAMSRNLRDQLARDIAGWRENVHQRKRG
jgi:hypothetical protein